MTLPLGTKRLKNLANDIEGRNGWWSIKPLVPNEQLSSGDSGKGVELLAKGSTDMSFHSTIIYSILDPRLGVASAPISYLKIQMALTKYLTEKAEKN